METKGIQKSGSVKAISKMLRETLQVSNKKMFVPFLNERDQLGRLLASQTVRRPAEDRCSHKSLNKPKKIANLAFLTSKNKSLPRVSKKSNDTLPVGLYNPKSIYQIQSTQRLPLFKSEKFSSKPSLLRSQSIDYVDFASAYKKKTEHIKVINLSKQLPRYKKKKIQENSVKLMIPRVDLPDYLKRLKGLYHIGELGKSSIYSVPKGAAEIYALSQKMAVHFNILKRIGNHIKTYGDMRVLDPSLEIINNV